MAKPLDMTGWPICVHASCAMRDGAGVLLVGGPGAGKSDLLLRLMSLGFALVADDRVDLRREGEAWMASAPAGLRGLLEVRGLGIFRLDSVPCAALALVVRLGQGERLPLPEDCPELGVPVVDIPAFLASSAQRVALALDCAQGRVDQLAGAFA